MGRSLRAAARGAGLHVETLRQNILAGVVRRPGPAPVAEARAAAAETEAEVTGPAAQQGPDAEPKVGQVLLHAARIYLALEAGDTRPS